MRWREPTGTRELVCEVDCWPEARTGGTETLTVHLEVTLEPSCPSVADWRGSEQTEG